MARVIVRPRARRDINAILVYYIETAGIDVASGSLLRSRQ